MAGNFGSRNGMNAADGRSVRRSAERGNQRQREREGQAFLLMLPLWAEYLSGKDSFSLRFGSGGGLPRHSSAKRTIGYSPLTL